MPTQGLPYCLPQNTTPFDLLSASRGKVFADKLMDEPPPLEASADRDMLPTLKNIEPSLAPPPTHDDDDLQEAD